MSETLLLPDERCGVCKRQVHQCSNSNCPVALLQFLESRGRSQILKFFEHVNFAVETAGLNIRDVGFRIEKVEKLIMNDKSITAGRDVVQSQTGNENTLSNVTSTIGAKAADEETVSRAQWELDVKEVLTELVTRNEILEEHGRQVTAYLQTIRNVVPSDGATVGVVRKEVAEKSSSLGKDAKELLKGILNAVTSTIAKTLLESALK
jgi:hypothetical protein